MNEQSLAALAQSVQSGATKATAVVDDCLQRLAVDEPRSMLSVHEQARQQAQTIDDRVASGEEVGPLAGVPFAAKDNFLAYGSETTAASRLLADFQAPYQATAIERLQAAGAVLVGKTNLDEFAHGSSSENSAFGPTLNPHDSQRVPGGSSGGSAAAVAAGLVPFALGTDTGGSIRLPASFCGVVGYKPTYGLVSRYGVIAMASSTDVIGPITQSAADTAYVLDVLAGPDPSDSTTIKRQSSYINEPMSLDGLRVGVIETEATKSATNEVSQKVEAAIKEIAAAGAKVQRVPIPEDELALAAYYIIVPAEISSNLARYDGIKYGTASESAENLLETYLLSRGDGFGEEPVRRVLTGTYVLSSGYQDAYYKQAQKVRTLLRKRYHSLFQDVDVLLGPTAPMTAFELGAKRDPIDMYMTDVLTISANLTGVPAVSLPLPQSSQEQLPCGLQLIGPQRTDKQLLDIAASVEALL